MPNQIGNRTAPIQPNKALVRAYFPRFHPSSHARKPSPGARRSGAALSSEFRPTGRSPIEFCSMPLSVRTCTIASVQLYLFTIQASVMYTPSPRRSHQFTHTRRLGRVDHRDARVRTHAQHASNATECFVMRVGGWMELWRMTLHMGGSTALQSERPLLFSFTSPVGR